MLKFKSDINNNQSNNKNDIFKSQDVEIKFPNQSAQPKRVEKK